MHQKLFCATLLVLLTAPGVRADGPTLTQARLRWLKGNYEEAHGLYETLAKDPRHKAAATIGSSRVLESQGEYARALTTVEAGLRDIPKNADLEARLAELLYTTGRWEEAEKAASAALTLDPKHFRARWVRAR